jgi:hypothetical protein
MSGRNFIAVARPNGDGRLGVPGPLVHLMEVAQNGQIGRERILSEDEARRQVAALNRALRALDEGRRWDAQGGGEPVAAGGHYPFRSHRTLAEVGHD